METATALRARATDALRTRGPDTVVALPEVSDPVVGAELDLLAAMMAPAFFVDQPLFQLLVPSVALRVLDHGIHRGAAYPLTFLGFIVQEEGDGAMGRAIGEAGLQMARRLDDPSARCRSAFVFAHHVQHWGGPLHTNLRLLDRAASDGRAAGDLQWAGYAQAARHMNLWSTGGALSDLRAHRTRVASFLQRTHNHPMLALLEAYERAEGRLTGHDPDRPPRPRGGLDGAVDATLDLQVLVCEGRHDDAWEAAQVAAAHAPFLQGCFVWADAVFYTGLAAAGTGRRDALAEAQAGVAARAAVEPGNFGHRALLLRGLLAAADGDTSAALTSLDRAAQAASDGGWLPEAALAWRETARLLDELGAHGAARAAREQELGLWSRWGAHGRAQALVAAHPTLRLASGSASSSSSGSSRSPDRPSTPLDLQALLEAGEILAGEVDEDRLIESLLRVTCRISGATSAMLLRPDDDGTLVVSAALEEGLLSWPGDDFQGRRAPHGLVGPARLSMTPQVVSDTRTDPRLGDTAWPFRSALCLPAVRHGGVVGLVFLSNRSLSGAFPPRNVALLSGLAGQMAAALATSTLFAQRQREADERIRAERALQRVQRLQTLGQISSGVAHDFNNLLAVILGWADVLELTCEEGTRQAKAATQIIRAAQRGAELTRQLLACSRRSTPEPEPVDLHAQVLALAKMADRVLTSRVHLTVAPARADLPPALVDPGLLEQVLMNLVVNARDAMPDGGRVHVSFDRVGAMPAPASGPGVVVRVRDEGDGIPPELLDRIFEPFFTTKGLDGTGLGLATCLGIVEQSGGVITVDSVAGEGATFCVHLPIAAPSPAFTNAPAASAPSATSTRRRALIVEDDDGVRELFELVLEAAGWAVSTAPDGPSALALLEGGLQPDVLLSDYSMPGMDGLALVQRARALLPDLPAVLISGLVAPPEALADGVRWEQKPFTGSRLRQIAEELAQGQG